MRTYEALYIVRPELKDDEIQTMAKRFETLVTDNGGAIGCSEVWGKRKLAYKVKHFSEGCYILLRFESDPGFVARLENDFRLSEDVIRYLVTHFDEKTLRLEAEQQRRKEAELRASAGAPSSDRGRPERRPAEEAPQRTAAAADTGTG